MAIIKINAPIKYFGGKGTMWRRIYEEFPEDGSYDTYIEPFGGSYAMGFKCANDVKNEIYNDLEVNVYSLYKVLSDDELFREFRIKCELSHFSEDLRREYLYKLRNDENLSIVDRAFMYFYTNRVSRNGIGGISINRSIRRGMSKNVSDYLSAIDRLPQIHERMSKVNVINMDGIELIKENNDANTFIYCDPPYDWSTRTSTRYKVDMNGDKQDEFLDTVINSKAKILISGYDCNRYDVLEESGFKKINFGVSVYSPKNVSKTKIETLWKNY